MELKAVWTVVIGGFVAAAGGEARRAGRTEVLRWVCVRLCTCEQTGCYQRERDSSAPFCYRERSGFPAATH